LVTNNRKGLSTHTEIGGKTGDTAQTVHQNTPSILDERIRHYKKLHSLVKQQIANEIEIGKICGVIDIDALQK
jgi:hypothetical protein